jgi:Skp family chaperone for outer membrane proteins
MKKNLKPSLAAAGIAISAAALGTLTAAPAAAQVNGIATVEPAIVIAQSRALQNAYQQIDTTYQAVRTQSDQLQQQRTALVEQLDTNNDGQVSDEEVAAAQQNNASVVEQIQGLDGQIAQVQTPMQRARIYVVEQVAAQYGAALQQVVSDKSITLILAPDAIVYGPNVDVTNDVATALNARVPSVSATPPADWQPNRNSVQTFQQVQQVLLMAAMQQQQQQGQQQGQAAPAQDSQVEGR